MIALATAAALSGYTLGLHLASAHLGSAQATRGLRTATPGLYLRTPAGLTAGLYHNSDGNASAYAGWTWSTPDGRYSLTAGGVTGYRPAPVLPLIVPSVRMSLSGKTYARFALLPKPTRGGAAALHISIERELSP